MNKLSLLLAGILAAFLLAGAACAGGDTQSGDEATPARTERVRQATMKPTPKPKPTPSLTPAPAPGWTRYTTDDFEIDLPDTWQTWDPTEESVDVIVAQVEERAPQLADPVEELLRNEEAPGWALAAIDTGSPAGLLRSFNVLEQDLEAPTTVRQIIAGSEEVLPDLGATLLSSDADLQIRGLRAGRIELALTGASGSRQLQYLVMPDPTRAFNLVFTTSPEDYAALEPTFEQIAGSFQVKEEDDD